MLSRLQRADIAVTIVGEQTRFLLLLRPNTGQRHVWLGSAAAENTAPSGCLPVIRARIVRDSMNACACLPALREARPADVGFRRAGPFRVPARG
jgi:hypothetical protein